MGEKKQIRIKSTKIAAPMAGIDGIHHAVRALFAYKKPAFYKELASAASLTPVYMSASLSSARDVGLTKLAGKRGLYELTSVGDQYGRLLTFGKEADCRELLRKTILENPLWSEIIAFLRVAKGQARDPTDLVLAVEEKIGKRWSPRMRSALGNNYSSILQYAGLIKLEKGKMISQIGVEVEMKPEEVEEVEEVEGMEAPKKPMIPTATEEFAEFRLPDSFILYVRKDLDAITFFEQQVKEGSVFASWIQFIKTKIKKEKA
ncbi:MAG: hypothetical protein ACE5OW_03535 [Candidatus Bathyarchaeia archaeon]